MKGAISRSLDKEDGFARRNQEADEAWEEYQRTGKSVSHETMVG